MTPTKPLTISHLKGLLWLDAMFKATAQVADVTLRYSHTTYDQTAQTLGFWEYLDRALGDVDYGRYGEEEIGELYMRYQAEPARADYRRLRPYARAVEAGGWVHPGSARVLELWADQYRALGLHDPGLRTAQPPGLGLEETIALLCERDLCIDARRHGGEVYLDGTAYGQPIRKIVSAAGQPNYLACALRELVPLAAVHDELVLGYDPDLTADYTLLGTVLEALGTRTHRVRRGRVPLDGAVRSAREGGWRGHTAGALLAGFADAEDPAAVRLGLRIYFIATLGKGQEQSYRADLLAQAVKRAGRLLAEPAGADDAELAEFVRRHGGPHGHVDPYRLTSAMLSRHRKAPVRDLAREVLS